MGNRQSIAERFDARRNSLNFIRLTLAGLVVIAHTWPVGGYGSTPFLGDQDIGDWAVAGFFTISGFLITGSRLASSSARSYYWKRFLRIYPGFLAALLVVAFVAAPVAGLINSNGSYQIVDGITYVLKNLGLFIFQRDIGNTLTGMPFDEAWNSPLWTLSYEAACYVVVGVLVSFLPRRHVRWVVIWVLVLCVAVTIPQAIDAVNLPLLFARGLRLGGFFAAGATLYFFRGAVPLTGLLAACAAGLTAVTMYLGVFQALAGLPVAYLLLYLGSTLPFHRIGVPNDISYGIYIYGFPIQQLLAMSLSDLSVPIPVFVALSLGLTMPLALASWFVVEKPALRLRRLPSSRRIHEQSWPA
ncbi:acyltransferase family protein [Subtercola boreus]|nr:acyltransferase [Subtercola boreus]